MIRQLVVFGSQGFNELASGLPGHISRSTLTDRLRRLEDTGLISRAGHLGARRRTS
jgi:DNA-binding HxlR family transcriptional regulator